MHTTKQHIINELVQNNFGIYKPEHFRIINNQIIQIHRYMFTTGLIYNVTLDRPGEGRFCYTSYRDALKAFNSVKILSHEHPPKDPHWIKHKSFVHPEYINPLFLET